MLLTKSQQKRFWRDWGIYRRRHRSPGGTSSASPHSLITDAQIENERHALLERAGFDSLTQVDPGAGFDRVLAELQALINPDDLDAQLRQITMPLERLRYACRLLAKAICDLNPSSASHPEAYLRRLLVDRFHTMSLDDLDETQLTQLRNTLAARRSSSRRSSRAPSPGGTSSASPKLQTVDEPF